MPPAVTLGLGIAFGARRPKPEGRQDIGRRIEVGIRAIAELPRQPDARRKRVGKTGRHVTGERGLQVRARHLLSCGSQDPGRVRQDAERHGITGRPVRGDLEDRRTRQPPLCVKSAASSKATSRTRAVAGKATPGMALKSASSSPSVKGTSAGRGRHHIKAEAPRDVVSHACRAHLGDRRPARRDYQPGRRGARHAEPPVGMADLADGRGKPDLDAAPGCIPPEAWRRSAGRNRRRTAARASFRATRCRDARRDRESPTGCNG